MLIEFSVSNFRSIKEKQTLSMVPNSTRVKEFFPTPFKAAPELVETAAIYGPNGSGKSNLILAMEFFKDMIINSARESQQGDPIDITPFLFSKETCNKPSEFEIVFIQEDYLFQYGFAVDAKKVHEEWLYATPKNVKKQKPQMWFERTTNENQSIIKIRKGLKGKIWEENTLPNVLFFSLAVKLNSKEFITPFEWIQKYFKVLQTNDLISAGFTIHQIQHGKKESILKFMRWLDAAPFEDISVSESIWSENNINFPKDMPNEAKQEIIKNLQGKKRREVFTHHLTEEGENYLLDFNKQSEGTKRLFTIAGPLLDVLEHGYTLIIDEISRSLHPYALKGIIALFMNKKINKKNAQLIFTTHDTTAMNFLDRNQIWLLDKGKYGNSTLTALTEFKGRADEAIEKRYLSGRYGALPNIKDLF